MQKIVLGAVIGAILLSASPAFAEDVVVRGNVTVGAPDHYRHWHHRHHWRAGYGGYATCTTVRVRHRLPNGAVVIRTRRTC